jgi:hypothetical protein
MSSYNDESNANGGRKALKIKRKEYCRLLETGTVEHNGVILKKVNTAIINHKKTTYFKCRNMRTPTHVTGVCVFSARIVDFPNNLDLEILHDHSNTCCYAKGKKDSQQFINKNTQTKILKNNFNKNKARRPNPKIKSLLPNKEVKSLESDILDYQDIGIDLPNIYIPLWSDEDNAKVIQIPHKFKLMLENIIK